MKLTKIIVAGASTAALAAGIGAGLAYADSPAVQPTAGPTTTTSSPNTTPTAKPTGKHDQKGDRHQAIGRRLRLLARALHGEVTLAGEKHQVIDFQRGAVQNVSAKSVTVESKDGFTETYVLSNATKVRKDKNEATTSDIEKSDLILVVATKDGSSLDARRVIVRST
jgi:hypothetical protein